MDHSLTVQVFYGFKNLQNDSLANIFRQSLIAYREDQIPGLQTILCQIGYLLWLPIFLKLLGLCIKVVHFHNMGMVKSHELLLHQLHPLNYFNLLRLIVVKDF